MRGHQAHGSNVTTRRQMPHGVRTLRRNATRQQHPLRTKASHPKELAPQTGEVHVAASRLHPPLVGLLHMKQPAVAALGPLAIAFFFLDVPYCTVELYTDRRPKASGRRRKGIVMSGCLILAIAIVRFVSTKRQEGDGELLRDSRAASVPTETVTDKELGLHNQEHDLWVTLDGVVYDVTEVVHQHPGGKEALLEYGGRDVGAITRSIGHSDFAVATMKKKPVGIIQALPESGWACCELCGPRTYMILVMVCLLEFFGRIIITLVAVEADAFASGYYLGAFSIGYRSLITAVVHLFVLSAFVLQPWRYSTRYFKTAEEAQVYSWLVAITGSRHMLSFLCTWFLMVCLVWRSDSPATFYACSLTKYMILFGTLALTSNICGDHCLGNFRQIAAVVPFWDGCPSWMRVAFVTWYDLVEIQAMLALLVVSGVNMYVMYLYCFPVQLAPFLLRLLDRDVISPRTYHFVLVWASAQVAVLFVAQFVDFWWCLSLVCVIYCLQMAGFSEFGIWICFVAADVFAKNSSLGCPGVTNLNELYTREALLAVGLWAAWFLLVVWRWPQQFLVSQHYPKEKLMDRAGRKLMSLSSTEQVSETLFLLSFKLPPGTMSGHAPGQHLRIISKNPSFEKDAWNRAPNLEADREDLSRCYAPVSPPSADMLKLLVKGYTPDAAKGFPDGGRVSLALTERLQLGEGVQVIGLFGLPYYDGGMRFRVDDVEGKRSLRAQHCAALVGGSGVSAALALLHALREEQGGPSFRRGEGESPFAVVQVVRSSGEALPAKWFSGTAPSCACASVATEELVKAKPQGRSSWWRPLSEGTDDAVRQGIIPEVRRTFPPPGPNVVVLVSGPRGFVRSLARPLLTELGYDNIIALS